MRVSSTLRFVDAPGMLRTTVIMVLSISISQVMADDDASGKRVGSKAGVPSPGYDAWELAYYGDSVDGDWQQATEQPDEVSPQVYDSLGPGCSGSAVSYAPGRPRKPHRQMPGDIDRGDCPPYRYTISDCERAGNPHCVASWAKLSITPKYSAGYVGGGAAWGGRSRYCSEGVWGLDYHGLFPYRRVWMRWTSGCEQGGEGAYKTDGHTGPFAKP
ncbi:MAG TPA: hypothetical protein DDZ51_11440 [Planctomycetaceae bacterium]|nr:hypothetical protein [Planctomycetaceae bacterium]